MFSLKRRLTFDELHILTFHKTVFFGFRCDNIKSFIFYNKKQPGFPYPLSISVPVLTVPTLLLIMSS
jgi:hypothetical protein